MADLPDVIAYQVSDIACPTAEQPRFGHQVRQRGSTLAANENTNRQEHAMTISMTLAETAYVSRTSSPRAEKPAHSRFMSLMIAGATALAMITASAMPAHADRNNDDLLKALAAIAAIAIISKAVKDNKRKHHVPAPIRMPVVPSICAIEIGSGRGMVTGFTERCLRREGFNYRLPSGCATRISVYGRSDNFYPKQCLRNAGFTIRPR
jgi:hypothetical protein